MTDPTAIAPRSPGNHWAYWKVNDLRLPRLVAVWKRRRTTQHFIPTEDSLRRSRAKHTCSCCSQPVTAADASREGKGVRGEYDPRTRRYVLMHYPCAWGATLEAIVDLGRRIG